MKLITPAEATATIARHLPTLPTEDCALEGAHGRVVRQDIAADRPMPPFDRVTMDGFAVRSADLLANPKATLEIIGYQAAGMIPQEIKTPGTTVEVGTGATLPAGADAVVPYEDTEREDNRMRLITGASCEAGQSVHREGSDFPANTVLVRSGSLLTGAEIAVAATVGASRIRVAARPAIAVVATGDELMEVDTPTLAPQQIRKSNDYAIRAALLQSQLAGRVERFHLRDNRSEIEAALRQILAGFDVTILTGGVSKGKRDHIPEVLTELGAVEHLRGIAQRPGKPMWFGTTPRRTPVFALPGNPVSTYTCLHRYVLPALRQMAGAPAATPETVVLGEPFRFPKPLAFMLPVQLHIDERGRRTAAPAPFNTSGDLGGLLGTDGFVELPAEADAFPAGSTAEFWRWT
jgi:molybdopterin molybdotransferase